MRKHAQSWIIKVTLFLVAIVFVFWGVGSFRSERATRV
ncbi:MAG: SurA N-terminal domain-containing protein, partial [Pseudomonadota bacterium]